MEKDKRIALIIGISDYQFASKLKNPINDAISMGNVLSKLGFETSILKNPTYKVFKLALNEFGKKLNEYDSGLFYFAGHGIQVKGLNYLIPSDANPLNENQVEFDCINANQILSLMSDSINETNFIILDACRNNPFERSWNRAATIKGLSYMSAPYGTLIAYSTAPDKTASDGEGNNGLYTSVLIDEILTPNLTILQVLQNVRSKLIRLSEGQQVPWESTSLINDYVFNDDRYISISTFCQSILYNHDRDVVLNNLKLNLWDIQKITKLGIPISKEDKEAGVIEVYYKNKIDYFDTFNELEIHIYENGKRDYNLFTTTRDANQVQLIYINLCKKLGGGNYDDERRKPFFEFNNIKRIAQGKAKAVNEQCFNMWYFDNVTFYLNYLVTPKRQLVFKVNIKPLKRIIDKTVGELIVNDFYALLQNVLKIYPEGEYKGKFIDYQISLENLEFNFFDKAVVKVFTSTKESKSSSSVFLTNSKSNEPNIAVLNNLVFKLTSIYGTDRSGEGYLSGIEEQNIKDDRYWSGREWDLNIQHQIYDMDSNGEEMLYGVHLHFNKEDNGIELSIIGYESLIDYLKNKNTKR
ncbi:MAG: caspase family protein [Bacteroidales bacterium]|nr:caspase family protein [Bacteroidales bacterium]